MVRYHFGKVFHLPSSARIGRLEQQIDPVQFNIAPCNPDCPFRWISAKDGIE